MQASKLQITVADETDPHGACRPGDFRSKPQVAFTAAGLRVRCPDGYGVIVSAEGDIKYSTHTGHADVALYLASARGWEPVTENDGHNHLTHVVRRYDINDLAAMRHATRPGCIAVHDRDVPQTWPR